MTINTTINYSIAPTQILPSTTASMLNISSATHGNLALRQRVTPTHSTPQNLQEIVQNLAHAEQILTMADAGGAPNSPTTDSGSLKKVNREREKPESVPNRNFARSLFKQSMPRKTKNEPFERNKCECVKTPSSPVKLQEPFKLSLIQPLNPTQTTKVQVTPKKQYKSRIQPMYSSPSQDPLVKPKWHEDAHRFIRDLSKRNQEEPIEASEIHQVRTWAHEIMASQNPDEMMLMLKLLSQYTFVGAKQIFFEVLKELRKVDPEINQYFKDILYDEAEEGPVLSTAGVHKLIRMQEADYTYPVGMIKVAGVSELSSLIEETISSPSPDRVVGWAVGNDLWTEDPHIVPVFVLKIKGKTHVFILDSLGHNLSTNPKERLLSCALEKLIEHFRNKPIDQQPLLYSYKSKRQHATSLDCVTFSLNDLKHLCERHIRRSDNLVTFFEKQDSKKQPRSITSILAEGSTLQIFEIDILPPELMKATQSKKQIQAYEANSPALNISSVPVFQRFNASGQILQTPQTLPELTKKVSENERIRSDEKAQNLYIDKKRLAQKVYVLALHYHDKDLVPSSSSSSSSSSSTSSSSTSTASSFSSPSSEQPVRRMLKFKKGNNE